MSTKEPNKPRVNKVQEILLIRDCAKAVPLEGPSQQRCESFRRTVLERMHKSGITAKDVAVYDRMVREQVIFSVVGD